MYDKQREIIGKPREGTDAGVGVGMLIGFLVSEFLGCWFLGFKVSCFFGYLVSKFLGCKDSKSFKVFERYCIGSMSSVFHFMLFARY